MCSCSIFSTSSMPSCPATSKLHTQSMKASATLVIVATLALSTQDMVTAKSSFLSGLPNGGSFSKSLGHSGNGFTAFGNMFSGSWSTALCKKMYPGSSITVGQAFGDPCCKWTKGATPDFAVSQTADFPAQSTQVCASGGGGGGGGGGATPGQQPTAAPSGGGGMTPTVTENTNSNKKKKKNSDKSYNFDEVKKDKKKKEKKEEKSEDDDSN